MAGVSARFGSGTGVASASQVMQALGVGVTPAKVVSEPEYRGQLQEYARTKCSSCTAYDESKMCQAYWDDRPNKHRRDCIDSSGSEKDCPAPGAEGGLRRACYNEAYRKKKDTRAYVAELQAVCDFDMAEWIAGDPSNIAEFERVTGYRMSSGSSTVRTQQQALRDMQASAATMRQSTERRAAEQAALSQQAAKGKTAVVVGAVVGLVLLSAAVWFVLKD